MHYYKICSGLNIEDFLSFIIQDGMKSKKNEDYLYPILEKGLTPKEEYDHIKTFVRNTNKRLTEIGKQLVTSLKVFHSGLMEGLVD